jgi:hypothetical protein
MSVAVYEQAPLEYRVAMDAACTWLGAYLPAGLRCDQPELKTEAEQRLRFEDAPPWQSGLWLEPQEQDWGAGLADFLGQLAPGARLAVVLSLPPARRLHERKDWRSPALGEKAGGMRRFLRGLAEQGVVVEAEMGLHSWQAVGLNLAGQAARRARFWALADRLEYAARLRYSQRLGGAWSATCALILGHKR